MAKGDARRMRNEINTSRDIGQTGQNQAMNQIYGQNNQFMNNYNQGTAMNMFDYNNIMNNYQGMAGGNFQGAGGAAWDPTFRGALDKSISGYGNFADTGGFSGQDLSDLRARAISPNRAVYANAQAGLDRSRSLQGGSPNYAAASAKMAREQGYNQSDATTNVNAAIAQMVQQGKLAGLGGLTNAGGTGQGLSNQISSINDNASYQNNATRLGAMHGMTNLYGTTPGLSSTFGNQVLNSSNQLLQGQELQNQMNNMLIQGRLGNASIPGNFQTGVNNVNSAIGMVSNAAGLMSGGLAPFLGKLGGKGGG
jgi:hypothetical protein